MANRLLPSIRSLRFGFAAALCTAALAAPASASPAEPTVDPGVVRTEVPVIAPPHDGARARRPHRVPPPLEEVVVFQDSLDGRSIEDEAGWTHVDNSARPTAWHIDTKFACQGKAWWCGIVDSSWTFDSNRAGYDNSWAHFLENSVWLDSLPNNAVVRLGFRHRFSAERSYDFGTVEVYDLSDGWVPLFAFTGEVSQGGLCDTFTVVIPESLRLEYYQDLDPGQKPRVPFRFAFTSDVAYSSADGLYDGDGWIVDNISVTAGNNIVRFFDNCESGPGQWSPSIFPPAGDYYNISSNVFTEDFCTTNRTHVWVMWDPVIFSLVPRLDNLLRTPAVATSRSSEVFVAFDVYRNLPLQACFYYHLRYRTRNIGEPGWSEWVDPTRLLYYGSTKDWARQKVQLPGAANRDSVQVELGVTDYSKIYCDGVSTSSGVYTFFDNAAIGIVAVAPPTYISRDVDLFNDTFHTGPFFGNDNINTPLGDSVVVEVNASRGYKSGFMHWRANGGSFSAVPLQNSASALPRHRFADVPAGAYPANTTIEYYFAVTDSLNATSYFPAGAITDQDYLSASVLPVKSATNPALGCFDSLATILYINNFSGREPKPYIPEALEALGYKFDTWDVNAPSSGIGNTPGGSSTDQSQYKWPPIDVNRLQQYSAIIWHAGNLNSFTIRKEDQALIQSWIQQTGKSRNLWITGDNVADELVARFADYNSFLQFTCGTRFLRDLWESLPQDSLVATVSGVPGSPSAGRSFHVDAGCPLVDDFDLLGSSSQAQSGGRSGLFLKYPNNFGAATRYATKYVSFGLDSARVVFMGFSFNAIQEGGERILLSKSVMDAYFGVPACYSASAVETDPAGGAPGARNALAQNAPNPFNPRTTIRYSVAESGPVTIRIFDPGGRLVRTLVDAPHGPGDYVSRWDGTDDAGRRLSSGVYFYRIETAAGFRDAKKLILLK
jgi:hypothetical protein